MILGAGVAGMGLTSCSTTEGLGKDLQKLGEKIEDKSQEKQAEQNDNYDY
jgi:predicted small secreted protein